VIRIATIVEGDGEVIALPVLLRRLAAERYPVVNVDPLPPIRVRRDRFLKKEEEFRKQLLLAAAKSGDEGWILIVLDADDDCPAELGRQIFERAQQYVAHRRLSVVLANREFEAWFIAAAQSLHGLRGFSFIAQAPVEAEARRNAKGWMKEHMEGGSYSEIRDQPAFTAKFDLQQAFDGSRSFRKLCKEWESQVGARRGSAGRAHGLE
jgi:hypothetical protein